MCGVEKFCNNQPFINGKFFTKKETIMIGAAVGAIALLIIGSIVIYSTRQTSAQSLNGMTTSLKMAPSTTPSVYGEMNPIDSYNKSIFDLINEIKSKRGYFSLDDINQINDLLWKVRGSILIDTPGFPTHSEIYDLMSKFNGFFDWERYSLGGHVSHYELETYLNKLMTLVRK